MHNLNVLNKEAIYKNNNKGKNIILKSPKMYFNLNSCGSEWALGSITTNKASGGDGIPAELFQILKDDAVKVLPANLENSAVVTGLEKVNFHSNPKEEQCQRMLKLLDNCARFPY